MSYFYLMASILLFSLTASATVSISPMQIFVDLKPGESKAVEVTIYNGTGKALPPLNVTIKPFINTPGRNMLDVIKIRENAKPDHEFDINSFIKVSSAQLEEIPSKTAKKVTINITVPKDYSKDIALFSYVISPASNKENQKLGFRVKTEFFGRGLVNVFNEKVNPKLDFKEVTVNKKGEVSMEVVNVGNKIVDVSSDLIVLDKNNKQLGKFEIQTPFQTPMQLMIPLPKLSYKLTALIPDKLVKSDNKLVLILRDNKRNFVQPLTAPIKVK